MADLYLEIAEDRSTSGYYHLALYPKFVKAAASADKNCDLGKVDSPDSYDDDEKAYCYFRVYSQGNTQGSERNLYAWQYHYASADVDANNVGRMAKLLAKIARGLEKIAEESGSPADFADYCGRIARVVKAKGFLRHRGRDTLDYTYRQMSIAEGIDYVRYCDRCYVEQGKAAGEAA